jgi:predicted nucleic acid-binding protein
LVPAHFDAEVFSALGRLARAGELAEDAVEPLLSELARAPFTRFAVQPLLTEAWKLRHNLALRDALYVTLARRLGARLVTADGRLAQAPALGVPVTFVANPAAEAPEAG